MGSRISLTHSRISIRRIRWLDQSRTFVVRQLPHPCSGSLVASLRLASRESGLDPAPLGERGLFGDRGPAAFSCRARGETSALRTLARSGTAHELAGAPLPSMCRTSLSSRVSRVVLRCTEYTMSIALREKNDLAQEVGCSVRCVFPRTAVCLRRIVWRLTWSWSGTAVWARPPT